jgi:hypothetical protein
LQKLAGNWSKWEKGEGNWRNGKGEELTGASRNWLVHAGARVRMVA